MFMTALFFPPSYSSLSAISTFLPAPIQKDSHIDVSQLTEEQAQPNFHKGGSSWSGLA